MRFGYIRHGCVSQFCQSPWANYLTSLCLNFPNYKMATILPRMLEELNKTCLMGLCLSLCFPFANSIYFVNVKYGQKNIREGRKEHTQNSNHKQQLLHMACVPVQHWHYKLVHHRSFFSRPELSASQKKGPDSDCDGFLSLFSSYF